MNSRNTVVPLLAAVVLCAPLVRAQQPATPAMPAVPASTCVRPELPPAQADPRRMTSFNREYKTYTECIKKYIEDTNNLANASIAAGKAAIDQFNALNAEIKAREDAK